MDISSGLFFFLICFVCLSQTANGVIMEKLAYKKICADKDCSYVMSLAKALDDYVASDCRYINLRRGHLIYVYSKLKPVEGAGVFWFGSVYGDRYVDQMGVIGYFPRNYVNETHIFQKKTVEIPTTVSAVSSFFA
ncbi:Otoraplin Precursor [Triplophysa tibetana]|uniref:Otoraplin n=1 Tax=Triplophysa tibetana TaxID=1572043 RepID=A0A5A9P6N5_9TELE|nr:Otoraplin Precursor [Triplophysa tibetana]